MFKWNFSHVHVTITLIEKNPMILDHLLNDRNNLKMEKNVFIFLINMNNY